MARGDIDIGLAHPVSGLRENGDIESIVCGDQQWGITVLRRKDESSDAVRAVLEALRDVIARAPAPAA